MVVGIGEGGCDMGKRDVAWGRGWSMGKVWHRKGTSKHYVKPHVLLEYSQQ